VTRGIGVVYLREGAIAAVLTCRRILLFLGSWQSTLLARYRRPASCIFATTESTNKVLRGDSIMVHIRHSFSSGRMSD
jgi:hypothetical protein